MLANANFPIIGRGLVRWISAGITHLPRLVDAFDIEHVLVEAL